MAEYQYIRGTGTVVPDTSTLRDQVIVEYKGVFGDDLITTEDTPQGVLITAETISRDALVRNNAAMANQINPNIAGGIFLDAIMALTGVERTVATRSVIEGVEMAGVPGTIIPAGSLAETESRDLFELSSSVVFSTEGTATGFFQSVTYGPINVISGSLNTIVSDVLGWDTVTNPSAAIPGKLSQNDVEARSIRRKTLAAQGVGLPEAVYSGVRLVEGVRSLTLSENYTEDPIVIDGKTLVEHSIAVCVEGGSDGEVALALLRNKSLGCGWNGDVIVDTIDSSSGQTYVVKFYRPVEKAIKVRVTISDSSLVTDPDSAVKTSIMAYKSGLQDGEDGFVVGASVSPFELSGAVLRDNPRIYVSSVEVALLADAYGFSPIPINKWELATLSVSNISVVTT